VTKVPLQRESLMPILIGMTVYSTAQVAKAIGVDKQTLLRWLWAGKLPEPKEIMGTLGSRVWSEAELKRAKAYREQNYRKRS
jgi:predicted site-specific integrase-resolvase